jgi:hypothetical protein
MEYSRHWWLNAAQINTSLIDGARHADSGQ